MGRGREKRKKAKAKAELLHKPSKAEIRKIAKKVIDALGDK